MNLKEKLSKHSLKTHAGLWLMLVAILAMESIACVQYFYTRATIKADAVYRAKSELRLAEQEINTAAVELEAAAKMLAKMAEFCLNDPDAMPGCVNMLFETLENVEGAGIAFVPDYFPQKGHWYEVYGTRNDQTEKRVAIRQIGGADHDYTQLEWFNNGLTKDHAYWSNPYADNEGAHTVVVTCSYPVRDADKRVVGVVCIDISLSKLKFIFDHLQVYPDSYYSIYTASGKDIVTPDTIPGRKYLVFDEEIDATGWKLSIIIPEDILFVELKRVGLIVNILMLLSLALLVFIMYRSTKNAIKMIDINNQKERMEGELEIAQTIQSAMLPKVFPPFADRPDLNIYGVVYPAKEVGGDLYDFYVRHDKLFFCVGDVSGKGVPASLVMAMIRSLFRSVSSHEEEANQIMQQMNNPLTEQNEQDMFVTLFVGVLDMETGVLNYCNGGHNAPVLVHKQETTKLDVLPNLPIGIMEGFEYIGQKAQIQRGDTIFLYTDGLTEAEDKNHTQYGEERMLNLLTKANGMSPRDIVETIQKDVDTFVNDAPQSDDLTMLAIRYQISAIVMRNDIQQIPTLAEWIEGLQVPTELSMPINLALEEIVCNVMLYAYPQRKDGKVFVEYSEKEDNQGKQLIFTISDTGIAFDPTQQKEVDTSLSAEDREIGGLGIHLVRQLMDEIRYERVDNKNILTLIKKINY
ncbi:MAG: SpoIIE family protein phosphatase [Paludibacteraceae bacterium]|nr:SpoIIE family protein phosphatase [Paludibacteraceae bacterium]